MPRRGSDWPPESRVKVVVIPGLTLPEVGEADLSRIRAAAGDGAEVVLCDLKGASNEVTDADALQGVIRTELEEVKAAYQAVGVRSSVLRSPLACPGPPWRGRPDRSEREPRAPGRSPKE